MGKLQINLLGTSFTIQANEDEEYLKKLLGYYSRIVDDVSQIESIKTPSQSNIIPLIFCLFISIMKIL